MWCTPDIVTICYTCYDRNRCRYQTLANSPALDNLCCSIVKSTKWPIWCVLNFPHLCCVKLSGSHLLTQVWTLSSGQKIMCQGEKMGQLYHLPEKWEIFPVMRLTKDQRSQIVKLFLGQSCHVFQEYLWPLESVSCCTQWGGENKF